MRRVYVCRFRVYSPILAVAQPFCESFMHLRLTRWEPEDLSFIYKCAPSPRPIVLIQQFTQIINQPTLPQSLHLPITFTNPPSLFGAQVIIANMQLLSILSICALALSATCSPVAAIPEPEVLDSVAAKPEPGVVGIAIARPEPQVLQSVTALAQTITPEQLALPNFRCTFLCAPYNACLIVNLFDREKCVGMLRFPWSCWPLYSVQLFEQEET